MVKKTGSIIALGGALVLAASTSGLAKTATLTQVSAPPPSPLADCSNAGQTGRNFPDAEVEPQVAVHGSSMIAMWHQDRWSNGGGHGIGVGVSSDGGRNWSQSTLPADMCTTGNPLLSIYQRNSDPWVSFGPDGTAYASALAFNNTNNFNAVVGASSSDGGATWNTQPIMGSVFTQSNQSTDKNATTADPNRPGVAYTVWDTLVGPTDQPDDNPHAQAYTGPAYFSETTDGGQSWTPARIIINTANRQQTIGNVIVVDPNPKENTLYDFTDLIVSPNTPFQGALSNAQLAFVKSTDGGANWSAPQVIAPFNSLGVIDPNTGQRLRVGDGLEEVAVDPSSGKLYVVYESSTNFNKNANQSSGAWDNEILLTTSSDKGQTWTAPTVVHKLASGLPTYTPTVAVNGGTVAVTYYDNRHLAPGQTANLPTDYWVNFSTDGGLTFPDQNEHHIAGPFDQLTAPYARGFFLGDYEGLQPSGSGFQAVFVKTNCNATDSAGQVFPSGGPCAPASSTQTATSNTNPTDVFTQTLTP